MARPVAVRPRSNGVTIDVVLPEAPRAEEDALAAGTVNEFPIARASGSDLCRSHCGSDHGSVMAPSVLRMMTPARMLRIPRTTTTTKNLSKRSSRASFESWNPTPMADASSLDDDCTDHSVPECNPDAREDVVHTARQDDRRQPLPR